MGVAVCPWLDAGTSRAAGHCFAAPALPQMYVRCKAPSQRDARGSNAKYSHPEHGGEEQVLDGGNMSLMQRPLHEANHSEGRSGGLGAQEDCDRDLAPPKIRGTMENRCMVTG